MMSDMSDKAITPGTTTVNLLATANTSAMGDTEKSSQSGAARAGAEIKMAKGRKWLLLAIFSLAQVGALPCSTYILVLVLYQAWQTIEADFCPSFWTCWVGPDFSVWCLKSSKTST